MAKRVLPLLVVLALAGCGGTSSTKTVTETVSNGSSTETQSRPQMAVLVYRMHEGALAPERAHVPRSPAVAAAALKALGIEAPVTIADGTARVGLDSASDDQVAEIVYTLTQFPSVRRVDVAGRTGLTRDDVRDAAPPIIVESPLPRDDYDPANPVKGTASVFEATLFVELHRNGKVLAKRLVTASTGAPERGTFSTTFGKVAVGAGPATVVAYSPSAANGKPQHTVEVPVTLTP